MNPIQQRITTRSPEETTRIAHALGQRLHSKCHISLSGDLGAGKTHFVQGLARGLAVPGEVYVTSPSYALVHSYPGRLPVHHADLYRLGDVEEIEAIGFFELLEEEAVVCVEWAERLAGEVAFDIAIDIRILGGDRREIRFCAAGLQNRDLIMSIPLCVKEERPENES